MMLSRIAPSRLSQQPSSLQQQTYGHDRWPGVHHGERQQGRDLFLRAVRGKRVIDGYVWLTIVGLIAVGAIGAAVYLMAERHD